MTLFSYFFFLKIRLCAFLTKAIICIALSFGCLIYFVKWELVRSCSHRGIASAFVAAAQMQDMDT